MNITGQNLDECLSRIAARGKMSNNEALKVLAAVGERADTMRQTGIPDPAIYAAQEMAEKTIEAAKQAKLDAVLNARVRTDKIAGVAEAGGAKGAFDYLRSRMHYMAGAARNDSVEGLWHANSRRSIAVIGNKLRSQGVEKAAISGQIDDQVAEAIWRSNGGAPDERVQISSAAQQIADALQPAGNEVRDRLNSAGARIGDAVDYVTRTAWDGRQLRRAAGAGADHEAAFEAWWAKERPRMADKTFQDFYIGEDETPQETGLREEAEKRMGRAIFYSRLTGVTKGGFGGIGASEGEMPYVPPSFEGTSNIAKAMSHQRVVYWKTSGDWLAHMREFGGGDSIYGQFAKTIDTGWRRYALMKEFGTNPEANLNMIIRRVQEQYRDTDPDGVKEFGNKITSLQNTMGRLDGSLNVPVNADRASMVEMINTLEATTHLGGVSVTHVAAAPMTVSAELAHHGVSHLDAVGKVLKAIFTGRGSAERQAMMAEVGGYSHGYQIAMHAHLKPDGGLPGYMSYAATQFMRLTGLDKFIDGFQTRAVKSTLMANLGHQADREFEALEPHVSAMLRRYGIGKEDWNLLRGADSPVSIEGVRYVTPSDINNVPGDLIAQHLVDQGKISADAEPVSIDRAIRNYRWDLGDRMLSYLNDAAEHATVSPGVRERALILGSSRPGEWGYTFRRFFSQFKMWPLAAYNQIVTANIARSLSRTETAQNFLWIAALSTAGGALRMSVNDMAVGRPQRNYMNPLTLLAAFAQGGGGGIYGDFLFGEVSRMDTSLAATLAGPVVGDAERLLKIYDRFRGDLQNGHADKAFQHMWPDLAHFAVGHVPFANLVYLKGALDYLLWYHLYEAASPGWWDRTNRRLAKEQGRTMQGYAPGQPIPYTAWGAGARTSSPASVAQQ